MSRFRFELATPGDDAELRHVLAATPMPGPVALSFRREPSFFDAAVVDGPFHQTIIARDSVEKRIAALATRSVRHRYVNGEPAPVGYLSSLRVLPRYRGTRILADGYRFLKELHGDGRAKIYLTTIAEGNDAALTLLTSGRAGLPRYHFAGKYLTCVVPLRYRGASETGRNSKIQIRSAAWDDFPAVIQFLKAHGPSRQFLPEYERRDFFGCHSTFGNLTADDLFVAWREGEMVGMLGRWDQRAFRQAVVESYAPSVQLARPLLNGWATLAQRPKLPQVGAALEFLTAALFLVKNDDVEVATALIRAVSQRANDQQVEFLLIGVHQADPLAGIVRHFKTAEYVTRLYLVCWDDGDGALRELDGRPPYLELGCL